MQIELEPKTKVRTFSDYLAFLISTIVSPYITGSIFIIVIVYYYSQNLEQFLPWVLTFFLFALILPGAYVLWLMEIRKIKTIHITDRKERKLPFALVAISAVVGTILLSLLGAAKPVVVVATIYAVNVTAIALITLWWKISVHTAIFSAITTMLMVIFGLKFAYLYLILLPLAWSRIHRRRHTILQTVAGAGMAFVLTAIIFWIFGYL